MKKKFLAIVTAALIGTTAFASVASVHIKIKLVIRQRIF